MKRLFGLIGYPLSHSFSASYFGDKFLKEEIHDSSYTSFEIKSIKELIPLIKSHTQLCGLNVTIPYKEDVIPLIDELSPLAEKVRAVNTIRILRDNQRIRLIGHNTDIQGFRDSLISFIGDKRPDALVLGSGGASKSVCHILETLGISYKIVSRTENESIISYNSLNENILSKHLLIINTSPLGMYPDIKSKPMIPYQSLTAKHFLFDLVYNPAQTAFMKEGLKYGACVQNGYDMLVRQAEASWKIWNSNY